MPAGVCRWVRMRPDPRLRPRGLGSCASSGLRRRPRWRPSAAGAWTPPRPCGPPDRRKGRSRPTSSRACGRIPTPACLIRTSQTARRAPPCTVVRLWWVRSSLTIAPHVDIIGRIRAPCGLRGANPAGPTTETGASCPGVEVLPLAGGRRTRRHRASMSHGAGRCGAGGVRAPIGRAGTVVAAPGCRPSIACVRDSPGSVCRSRFDTIPRVPQGGIE